MRRGFTHESQRNESKEWYTPPEVFTALGMKFDLDPCGAPGGDFVPARARYTIADDGLRKPWAGCVFVNPPYGQETPRWAGLFARHRNGIMLVFSRTDTDWFHGLAPQADLLCFTRGRLSFVRPDGTRGDGPGSGSLFVAMGPRATRHLERSGLGLLWTPRRTRGLFERG